MLRDWIHLTDPKSFSRLLYPNPVCLLSTAVKLCDPIITQSLDDEPPVHNDSNDAQKVVAVDAAAAASASVVPGNIQTEDDCKQSKKGTAAVSAADNGSLEEYPRRNVMVLSWLTATNNQGNFVFSLCKRRHTASILQLMDDSNTQSTTTTTYFVLSVPVRGMEQLVLEIGGVSGRWGSKFPDDYPPHPPHNTIPLSTNNNNNNNSTNATIKTNNNTQQSCSPLSVPLSKRQKKKQRRRNLPGGIPGLKAVPFGHADGVSLPTEAIDSKSSTSSSSLFAIHGTVAHLKCRMVSSLHHNKHSDNNASTMDMDDEHHLVMAQVMEAHVHPLYWNSSKSQFCPQQQNVPPYLTFLGSQTFGYVTVDNPTTTTTT